MFFLICVWVGLFVGGATVARAQNDAQGPVPTGMELLDIDPFDIIAFTAESGGGAVRTLPLPFPGRKVPQNQKGFLMMTLVGFEGQKFQAAWKDIDRIQLWEERLLSEVKRFIAAGQFDEAYPLLRILLRDYPQTPGLRELHLDYLLRNAAAFYRVGRYKQTLAILESLREEDRRYQSKIVLDKISIITDRLMKELVDQGELLYAQKLHARLERDYASENLPSIKKWADAFLAMAAEKRDAALAARSKKDYRSARRLARESYSIWPRIEGAKELIALIDREYPLVNVGVLQTATLFDPTLIDNWAARRAGRLLYRSMFEITGAGSDGGEYEFLFGKLEVSDDRQELYFEIDTRSLPPSLQGANSFNVSQLLMDRATTGNPDYFEPWAAILKRVEIPDLKSITTYLNRPHVVPASLMQRKIDGGTFGGKPDSPTGQYRFDVREQGVTRFVFSGEDPLPNQPVEIVEIELGDSSDAVPGLLSGELDVVDQLFPADAARLRNDARIAVETYPLPSIHMLVPCSDHAYMADRMFRRALVYGIDRQSILEGELLGGKPVQGCQVLSGPFPAGIELNDPLGYAYNKNVATRKYEPRLASLLVSMTRTYLEAVATRKKETAPELAPVRIGYPATDIANVAVEAIKTQLSLVQGLKIETIKFKPGQTWPDEGQCDLVYVMASVWEPVTDARRIMGPEGLARSNDQRVGMGLRRLEMSKNWHDVSNGLHELHRIANHELPVIALWQLVDSYAYRKEIRGVGRNNVSLYQSLDKWRLSTSLK